MSPAWVVVDDDQLDAWCRQWLSSPLAETLEAVGHLSAVRVVRLEDGRVVVVKVRPAQDRLAGCAMVHRQLWERGFPCPELLVGPRPLGRYAVSAEAAVPADEVSPVHEAEPFAALLAELIRSAPEPDTVPALDPPPAWIWWYHGADAVWPPPDDRDADLNAHPETSWLDELGRRARQRLAAGGGMRPVIGHCDFESHNIWWRAGRPLAVHDWDSVVCEPEPVIVGVAAAMWPAGADAVGATVEQSQTFLDAYQRAAGRRWSTEQVEAGWAAGLWVRTFNAKKASLDGLDCLDRTDATQRARYAGL